MEKGETIIKRIGVIILALFSFVVMLLGALQIGVACAANLWTHWRPSYEKMDIAPILSKSLLTAEDYDTLYRQTGIARSGIDDCLATGDTQTILRAQDVFFAAANVHAEEFAPFTYMERTDRMMPLAPLKDGDILITASTRFSFLRYGHSALVVDGDNGLVLESVDFTTTSKTRSASIFSNYANFILLRPKVEDGVKAEAVEYAKQKLTGLPYSLSAGLIGSKFVETPTSTQCAHLVWSAYMHCGVDLERDSGVIMPRDFLTDKVEVVQVYGFDLDSLWR